MSLHGWRTDYPERSMLVRMFQGHRQAGCGPSSKGRRPRYSNARRRDRMCRRALHRRPRCLDCCLAVRGVGVPDPQDAHRRSLAIAPLVHGTGSVVHQPALGVSRFSWVPEVRDATGCYSSVRCRRSWCSVFSPPVAVAATGNVPVTSHNRSTRDTSADGTRVHGMRR
jgi:hypothetical protein